jgi:type I restriction enzyme M protein
MSSNQSGEGEIRKAMIEADLVDCMIALPGQLFYSTPIPVCLWFLARDKRNAKFRKLGKMIDRVHRDLTGEDIQRIAQTYHAWRGGDDPLRNPHSAIQDYQNVPGFCKSATLDDIRGHSHVLTPGRYVGAEEAEDDDEPFDQKMHGLTTKLKEQFAESATLQKIIIENLRGLDH